MIGSPQGLAGLSALPGGDAARRLRRTDGYQLSLTDLDLVARAGEPR
jgi:hypothetical protein